jgi:hypothetical protein
VLTGSEQWKPGQVIACYILTKKYYPLPQTFGGFQLDFGGRSSTLVLGRNGEKLTATNNAIADAIHTQLLRTL